MTPEKLIAAVMSAPVDRHAAIFKAAAADPGKPKMGTLREAADILGVNPRTIARYERRGLLTARRLSKRMIRYDLGEVERLLASKGAA